MIAAPSVGAAPSGPTLVVAPFEKQIPTQDLARFTRKNFLEDRRRIEAGLTTPAEDPSSLIDLAEFLLAHKMAVEGGSLLDVFDDDVPLEVRQQWHRLELAFDALDYRAEPRSLTKLNSEQNELGDWPDAPLFRLLHLQRNDSFSDAASELDAAMSRVGKLSAPLQTVLLPAMLHVAVEVEDWENAQRLASEISGNRDLKNSAAFQYLAGRTAEAAQSLSVAFENYENAGSGNDLWSHRARMAMIELGIKNKLLSNDDALAMMQQATRIWRGDQHEVEALRRLTALYMEMGDNVGALEALAAISIHFPGTPFASMSRQQARSLWTAFYSKVNDKPLSELLEGHHRIAMNYRFEQGIGASTETLADRFMSAGATAVAADEYRETHDYLLVSRDLGLGDAEDSTLDRLRLKQVDALMSGGQLDEAAYVLAEELLSDDPTLNDKQIQARARLRAMRGDQDGVVRFAQKSPTLSFLRLQAAAHFKRGDWPAAQSAYASVVDHADATAHFPDVARLLLSAHRAGDGIAIQTTLERFPDLADRPEWVHIAAGMTAAPPPLLPLKASTAGARIRFVEDTLAVLDAIGSGEPTKVEQ